MGCDYYADENGVFKAEIRLYDNSSLSDEETLLESIFIENLDPREPLTLEIIIGDCR